MDSLGERTREQIREMNGCGPDPRWLGAVCLRPMGHDGPHRSVFIAVMANKPAERWSESLDG